MVIENIERHAGLDQNIREAIIRGAGEVGTPTFLSTLCICIVFVPVFLLEGTAKYLFSPLSVSVITALLASLVLSFTLVPVLFRFLMGEPAHAKHSAPSSNIFARIHQRFERGFSALRESYRNTLSWCPVLLRHAGAAFLALMLVSLLLFPLLGRDFFPQVDAGQMRLHVRAAPGTRLESTQQDFAAVEATIRKLVGTRQINVILDNIGLPYSGINLALSDSATVGPMDGEILISLDPQHTPTAELTAMLRRELPQRFPQLTFFFQPADIVDQVLNFGEPAPIDIRVTGSDAATTYATALDFARKLNGVAGVVDSHVFQVPDAPSLTVDVDRAQAARSWALSQRSASENMLVTTNSSAQSAPNFWGRPAQRRELPTGGAAAHLQHRLDREPADHAVVGQRGGQYSPADEHFLHGPRQGAARDVAAEHPPAL